MPHDNIGVYAAEWFEIYIGTWDTDCTEWEQVAKIREEVNEVECELIKSIRGEENDLIPEIIDVLQATMNLLLKVAPTLSEGDINDEIDQCFKKNALRGYIPY